MEIFSSSQHFFHLALIAGITVLGQVAYGPDDPDHPGSINRQNEDSCTHMSARQFALKILHFLMER
jgi:hypothetical protein